MADPHRVEDVVTDVTVQALREFSTGDMAGDTEVTEEGQWATNNNAASDEPTDRTTGRGGAGGDVIMAQYSQGEGVARLDEDGGGDYEDDDDDDSDDENTRVVLDPDHPLMQRFQVALNKQLSKENEKLLLQLRELEALSKNKLGERVQVGQDLYGLQQELARHQMLIEKMHDEFSTTRQERVQQESQLEDVRKVYRDRQLSLTDERKKNSELQSEVENLALRIFYMENAKEDVRSDIAVMKRAAEKAEQDVNIAEIEKKKQDLFVDRLVERLDKLRQDAGLFIAQATAQKAQTEQARQAVAEAQFEIDSIEAEKKQLFQQWNSSLIGMRRRDEAHSAMTEALNQQRQLILSKETEIENLKRSVGKEQEKNEQLTAILNKNEGDIMTVKKQMQQCTAKHDALKNEYATYSRMLHETETALARAGNDKKLRQNELNALRKQIEKEYLQKVNLEDQILEFLRAQLTMDKAAEYTDKLTGRVRERTLELDQQMAESENAMAQVLLGLANTNARMEQLKKQQKEQDIEFTKFNRLITASEAEIGRRNTLIERKQGMLDQLNKKLELLIAKAGGVELGPLEIQINSLGKSVEAASQEISEMQQLWLREQSELVHTCQDQDDAGHVVGEMKKQLNILNEKKLRMERDIERQAHDRDTADREIRQMRNEIIKLNTLVYKHGQTEDQLQKTNLLMESHFVGDLKASEKEALEQQAKLEELKEEKDRLLNSLVEAERQIALWEKKTQLAIETKAAVDSEVGQGEIRNMRAEIHRMEVRYAQLMKQQERMMKDMEKSVSRRETIVTRGDAQIQKNRKVLTKATLQRQLQDLRKKIKQTVHDAQESDIRIKELREYEDGLGQQLEDKRLDVQQLQSYIDNLDGDVDRLLDGKHKNLADLVMLQQKAKYYQQVKEGRYQRLFKTDSSIELEIDKQYEKMNTITAIAERIMQDVPHMQPALKKVMLAFGSKLSGQADGDE